MSGQDHRTYSIPLFGLGAILLLAGLVGIVVDATTDLATNSPAGVAATGAILVFASVAITVLLNPLSSLGAAAGRSVGVAGALAVAVILLAAIAGGSSLASVDDEAGAGAPGAARDAGAAGGAGAAGAAADGLLASEAFAGSLRGASAPGPLGIVGGAGSPSATHALNVPGAARSLRVEVHWEPATTGGAQTLDVMVRSAEGETLGSASGGPGLTLDVEDLPADADLLLVVSLPPGAPSAGQDYDAYASSFEGAIPASFTAHEM